MGQSTPQLVIECLTALFTAVAAVCGILNHLTGKSNATKLDTVISNTPTKDTTP